MAITNLIIIIMISLVVAFYVYYTKSKLLGNIFLLAIGTTILMQGGQTIPYAVIIIACASISTVHDILEPKNRKKIRKFIRKMKR